MSKAEKKELRKASKALNIISRMLNVTRSVEPEPWVMVWGAGLGTGTPKIALFNFLQPGPVEIRYYDKQPFCTARFETTSQAIAAKTAKHGKSFPGMLPIYIDYLAEEPPPEDESVLSSFANPWPKGLTLLENFITEEEEKFYLQQLFPPVADDDIVRDPEQNSDTVPVAALIPPPNTKLKHRLVRHYGYEFRYKTNDVDFDSPNAPEMPRYLIKFFSKMMEYNIIQRKPEQLTMNCYTPGQGIPPHVDAHSSFEQPIMSLSLGAPVVMDFRNGKKHVSVFLPSRSLLVMNDEARYLWTHGIAHHRQDIVRDPSEMNFGVDVLPRRVRVSLTFRLLNESRVCHCKFPQMCDSQRGKLSVEIAPKIERDLVHKVYDQIADHFSSTRHTPWPRVKDFLDEVAKGQSVLDVGCGNGKYFNLTDYIYQVGMDMSKALLKIAREQKNVDGVRANCLRLPFKDESFDAVICIAVLHHLSTKERRLEALCEIYRILNPGGRALIYVWAKDQKFKEMKSCYAQQMALKADKDADENSKSCAPRDYSFLPVHLHEENFVFNDMLVPWLKGSAVHHRFYHVFQRGELEELIAEIPADPAPRVIDSYYDQGNWCVVIQKDDYMDANHLLPYPRIPPAALHYNTPVSTASTSQASIPSITEDKTQTFQPELYFGY